MGKSGMIILESSILKDLMVNELTKVGVNSDSIKHVTESLIQTSLRGVDSHGINLFPHYVRAVKSGRINKNPNLNFLEKYPSSAKIDADQAFGHYAGAYAIQTAVEMAKNTGIACINVTNSTHFGAASYFGLMAAEKDCIGMSFTNADALVKAFGGTKPYFGTNPICFTAPLVNEEPLCLDMATSQFSWNKILNYRRLNNPLPAGIAFDQEGKETLDSTAACFLGAIGLYKGYGLGMMVDILCGILGNGLVGPHLTSMYKAPIEAKRNLSQFYIVIDISKFVGIDEFKNNLQNTVNEIRSIPPEAGTEQVMVPGDPEKKTYKVRLKEGIPIDNEKFSEFIELNEKFKEAVIKNEIPC